MGTTTRRRDFIKLGTLARRRGARLVPDARDDGAGNAPADGAKIAQAGAAPVLRRELLPSPVTIESVELLKAGDQYLVRVRSQDGATGLAAGHPDVLESTWPILTRRVAPFFVGKDARDLESLIDGVYLANSNYKWQGLPFWVPVASVEFAILDLLGQVAKQAARRTARRRASARDRRLSRQRQPRQLARGGDRVPAEARRRNRREGDQVPARRAHALRRRLDAPRPGADSADAQDLRRRR